MKTATLHLALCCSALACLSGMAVRAQSVPLEAATDHYKQWDALSHKLEATPFDADVNRDAEMAVHEIGSSPDFHTPLCSSFFSFFNKLTLTGYPYQAQIYRLYTLASAAYRIETGKTDPYGTNLYAFTSVLKGYSVMVSAVPAARDRTLEDLYITDLKGKLPEYLKKDSSCK